MKRHYYKEWEQSDHDETLEVFTSFRQTPMEFYAKTKVVRVSPMESYLRDANCKDEVLEEVTYATEAEAEVGHRALYVKYFGEVK